MNQKRRVLVIAGVVAIMAALAASAAQPMSSLTVRQRLVRCLTAVNGLYIGAVKPRTLQVATLNRKVHVVQRLCNGDSSVLGTQAGRAFFDLSLGVGYYSQYLISVAFEHPRAALLRDAKSSISTGKAEARRVLA